MESSDLMSTALRFNERINQQDLEGLAELMTNDHTFVDSDGNITKGKDVMKEGWREFFKKHPDYRNKFTCVAIQSNVVVMVGYSTCSYKPLMVQMFGLPNTWWKSLRMESVLVESKVKA